MTRLVDAGPRRQGLEPEPVQGHRHRLGRRARWSARATRRTSRAGTTSSTGKVDVLEPNPFTSGGAKWNIMAAYGAQLEEGKSPQEAEQYLAEAVQERARCSTRAPASRSQTFSSGKGDVLLGYENEAILAQQKGEDIDYIVPDQTILIENPVAADERRRRTRSWRKAFVDFLYTPTAQKIFAGKGYRPVVKGTPRRGQVPDADGAVRHHEVRRLGQGQRRSSSTRRRASWRRSSRPRGRALRPASASRRRSPSCGAEGRPHPGGGPRPWPGHRLPEHRRADPAGGGGLEVARRTGSTRFWNAVTSPQAVAVAEAHADRVADRRARSTRVFGHADRLGAGARRVPRQGHRQLADRPAVRAADDRRRPDAARASTGRTARWASTSPSRARRWCWRCCS